MTVVVDVVAPRARRCDSPLDDPVITTLYGGEMGAAFGPCDEAAAAARVTAPRGCLPALTQCRASEGGCAARVRGGRQGSAASVGASQPSAKSKKR